MILDRITKAQCTDLSDQLHSYTEIGLDTFVLHVQRNQIFSWGGSVEIFGLTSVINKMFMGNKASELQIVGKDLIMKLYM